MWFKNFYSPICSHCHHLAPVWRKIAKDLEGVIRIGAFNYENISIHAIMPQKILTMMN